MELERKYKIAIVVVVLVGLGVALYFMFRPAAAADATDAPPSYVPLPTDNATTTPPAAKAVTTTTPAPAAVTTTTPPAAAATTPAAAAATPLIQIKMQRPAGNTTVTKASAQPLTTYTRTLPVLTTTVALWYDATCTENIVDDTNQSVTPALKDGMPVRAWGPMLGTTWAGPIENTLIASNVSSSGPPMVRFPQPNRPGVLVPTGGIMGSRTPIPVSLFGRAVFVVCTLTALPTSTDPMMTILTDRETLPGQIGSVILRADFDTVAPRMVSWLRRSDGWSPSYWPAAGTPVVVNQVTVWCLQYTQEGPHITLRQLPNAVLQNTTPFSQGMANTSVGTPAKSELKIGGWRAQADGESSSYTGEYGKCILHEIVVFSNSLPEAELVSVYNSLVQKWQRI